MRLHIMIPGACCQMQPISSELIWSGLVGTSPFKSLRAEVELRMYVVRFCDKFLKEVSFRSPVVADPSSKLCSKSPSEDH
jgi:hypothetical protein